MSPTTRRPGSVAEVLASEEGPAVAAFFDLDGTLVAGFTALVHSKERLRSREVKAAEALRLITTAIDFQIGRAGFDKLITDGARVDNIEFFCIHHGVNLKIKQWARRAAHQLRRDINHQLICQIFLCECARQYRSRFD